MQIEIFLALLGFAAVTLVTPGPNNMMLMASGTNFGYRRTVPHLLGISIGFGTMVFLVGMGLMTLFEQAPVLQTVLKIVAIAYLSYLAWKIAHAAPPEARQASATGRPFSFLQAAAFQWVNPKGWTMALTSIAAFAPDRSLLAVLVISVVFLVVNLPSGSFWMILGQQVRRLLTHPGRLRAFNLTMAVLLMASLIPVLFA